MSKQHRSQRAAPSFLTGVQRINKLLAAAGLGSRRQVDELILEGRVEIDGETVTQVGIKVDADEATILVDGEPLKRHKPVYYAVHKPAGFLCTNADPEGRPRVIELVPADARLFPVGRLDASSTGLILLTNDGELAQRLAHPKHSVPKTYFVVVAGQVERDAMRRLQRGIYLAEGVARVDGAKIRKVRKGCTEIDIVLSEGKNREIRRVLARLGHKVVVLRRTAIGPLKLADMPEGSYRQLQDREVAALYQAVDDIRKERNQDRRERKKRSEESRGDLPKATNQPRKGPPPIFDEEGGDEGIDMESFEADSILDSLPPMSQNPYRTEDDDDFESDEEFADSILVSDINSSDVYSSKRGSVLSYDQDEELDSDSEENAPPAAPPRNPREGGERPRSRSKRPPYQDRNERRGSRGGPYERREGSDRERRGPRAGGQRPYGGNSGEGRPEGRGRTDARGPRSEGRPFRERNDSPYRRSTDGERAEGGGSERRRPQRGGPSRGRPEGRGPGRGRPEASRRPDRARYSEGPSADRAPGEQGEYRPARRPSRGPGRGPSRGPTGGSSGGSSGGRRSKSGGRPGFGQSSNAPRGRGKPTNRKRGPGPR